MKKRPSDNKYGLFALALAAFAAAGTAPALAQSSGTWSAGISGRSGTPYVHTQSTNVGGYGAYAQVPATIRHLVLQYSTAPAFAQSSGTWSAGISARSGTPYVHTQLTNVSGYGADAQVPATTRHQVLQYRTAPAFAQSSGSWSAGISGRNGRPLVPASSTDRIDRIAPGKLASGPQDLAR